MKIVYRARDISEAHIVAGLLHAQGITSHVSGYYLQGAVGDLGASDFANVQVEDNDFAGARVVIAEYERGGYEGQVFETPDGSGSAAEELVSANDRLSLTSMVSNAVWVAALVLAALVLTVYLLLT